MNDDGKKCGVKKGSAKAAVLQVTLCALLLAGTATAALAQMPNFPDYLKTAKETNLDNLRGMRYCEIFFMGVDPSVKDVLIGQVFNTSELNNKSNPLDTCPGLSGPRSIQNPSSSNTAVWGSSRTVRGAGHVTLFTIFPYRTTFAPSKVWRRGGS
jgi:hypothetical protein